MAHLSRSLKIQGCFDSRLNMSSGCLHLYRRKAGPRPIKEAGAIFGFAEAVRGTTKSDSVDCSLSGERELRKNFFDKIPRSV